MSILPQQVCLMCPSSLLCIPQNNGVIWASICGEMSLFLPCFWLGENSFCKVCLWHSGQMSQLCLFKDSSDIWVNIIWNFIRYNKLAHHMCKRNATQVPSHCFLISAAKSSDVSLQIIIAKWWIWQWTAK
jgi:hypothetical protein